mmetsp:Transcript_41275/g.46911  ORF Transcript_41275/g.46911 Transcript_41275/m.46911 type:complete len:723 (+) Transcript_41275:42-2210(+)
MILLIITTALIFCSDPSNAFLTDQARNNNLVHQVSKSSDLEEILRQSTVSELKTKLRIKGLPVSGIKPKLIERLVENIADDENENFTIQSDETVITDFHHTSSRNELSETEGNEIDLRIEGEISNGLESNPPKQPLPISLPEPLLNHLLKETNSNDVALLPVQKRAFDPIVNGSDAVLFAPTGSGKTLGYVLPLFTRLLQWKKEGILKKRKRLSQEKYYKKRDPVCPSILVLAPSRELAQQIGKVLSQYHPTSSRRVAAVFGGVPLERHASLLRREVDVVVGTPGRVRELMREGHLDTGYVKSIVLDEADVLLNFDDQPEIEMLLKGMTEDYQLVLASATIGQRVKKFMGEVMEIDEKSDSFIVVDRIKHDESLNDDLNFADDNRPKVNHWFTAARSTARPGLAAEIIVSFAPRLGIIFVASKIEVERVAAELSEKLPNVKVNILHGDMSQATRSRSVASLREEKNSNIHKSKILVATDVASRGLDLPGVDLVLQFGIPRKSGKEGTYNPELYIHRAGRAGRVGGGSKQANAIVLYDPSEGETRLMPHLEKELSSSGIKIKSRSLPSPKDIMEASYTQAVRVCNNMQSIDDVTSFFKEKIVSDMNITTSTSERENELISRLSEAMAALSGLRKVVTSRSLLTADEKERTVRVWSDKAKYLDPPEVIQFVKKLGSGKLGRITICNDGSAVFDLPVKRANRLVQTYQDLSDADMHIELPSTIEF